MRDTVLCATMNKSDRIFVAGHKGLVGSAIVRNLRAAGFDNLLLADRATLELTRQADVDAFFATKRPAFVFMAAAKVGGIHANDTYAADFIRENLQVELNVIDAAYRNGVQKLMFLGSSCIYPRLAPQPMPESSLLTGPLEPTNEWYRDPRRSRGSSCARLIASSTASGPSRRCRRISTGPETISICRTRTCCRR